MGGENRGQQVEYHWMGRWGVDQRILVDNPAQCYTISKYLWNQILFRISDWNRISQKGRGVGVKFWDFS
jgi:hypothetical protein